MRMRNLLSLSLLVLLLVPASVLAQDWTGRGRLRGKVLDLEGKPVADATVTLTKDGEEGRGPEPFTTNKKGRWAYTGLVTGSWTIEIVKEGFLISEGTKTVSEYGGGPGPEIKITLKPDVAALQAAKTEETMGHLEKGNMLLQQAKYAEARAEYEAALSELDEKQKPLVRKAIADTLMAEKKFAEARSTYEAILPTAPEDLAPAIRREVARSFYQEGKVDEAIGALESATTQSPDDIESLRLLINVLVAEGREKEAEPYMAKLPEGEKVDANALLNLGITAFNDGDLDEALAKFDRVIEENPDNGLAFYYRGLTRLNKNELEGSKADFQKMLELIPDHELATEAKQYLEYL